MCFMIGLAAVRFSISPAVTMPNTGSTPPPRVLDEPVKTSAVSFGVTFNSTTNPSSTWGFMQGSAINLTFTETGNASSYNATLVLCGNSTGPIPLGTQAFATGTQLYTLNISSYTPVEIPTGDYDLNVSIVQGGVSMKNVTLALDIARAPAVPGWATVACAWQWSGTTILVNSLWGPFYPFPSSELVITCRVGAAVENFTFTPTYPGYKTETSCRVTLAFGGGLLYNVSVGFVLYDNLGQACSSNNTITVQMNPLYSNYPVGYSKDVDQDWGDYYVGTPTGTIFFSEDVSQIFSIEVVDWDNASITANYRFLGTTSQSISLSTKTDYVSSSAASGTLRLDTSPFNTTIYLRTSGSERLYICGNYASGYCFGAGYQTFSFSPGFTWTFTRPVQKIPALPGVPVGLAVTAGTEQVTLYWKTPKSNGGWPVTSYNIYMGTSPGAETLLATVGNVTGYNATGLTGGQVYYFKVSTVTKAGEGATSNEVSATPASPPPSPSSSPAGTIALIVVVLSVLGIGVAALTIAIGVSKKKRRVVARPWLGY